MKILVVEDSLMVCDVIVEMLRGADHEVTACGDSEDAIDLLAHGAFDLLVTDIILPHGSGFDIVDYIRRNSLGIPILAVSGHISEVVRRAAGDSGDFADILLYKPFSESDLLLAVEALAEKSAGKGNSSG